MIYFTSDLHLNHDLPSIYEPRGFSSIHEMNDAVLNNFNSVLTADDELYILGDLMLRDNSAISIIKQLRGSIHIVRGNHDSEERVKLYRDCWNVVEVSEGQFWGYKGHRFFLSHWPTMTSPKEEETKKFKSRIINLCGHRHTKDRFVDFDKGLIYHVELDAHNMMPVSIEWIMSDIRKKLGIE